MALDMSVSANKRIRGQILNLLHVVYPASAEVRTIVNALIDGGYISSPDIARHTDYLIGKGYAVEIDYDDDCAKKLMNLAVVKRIRMF